MDPPIWTCLSKITHEASVWQVMGVLCPIVLVFVGWWTQTLSITCASVLCPEYCPRTDFCQKQSAKITDKIIEVYLMRWLSWDSDSHSVVGFEKLGIRVTSCLNYTASRKTPEQFMTCYVMGHNTTVFSASNAIPLPYLPSLTPYLLTLLNPSHTYPP